MKKLSYKYYIKQITTRDNGNVQSHDQEKVNWAVPLTRTVVLIQLHMNK